MSFDNGGGPHPIRVPGEEGILCLLLLSLSLSLSLPVHVLKTGLWVPPPAQSTGPASLDTGSRLGGSVTEAALEAALLDQLPGAAVAVRQTGGPDTDSLPVSSPQPCHRAVVRAGVLRPPLTCRRLSARLPSPWVRVGISTYDSGVHSSGHPPTLPAYHRL